MSRLILAVLLLVFSETAQATDIVDLNRVPVPPVAGEVEVIDLGTDARRGVIAVATLHEAGVADEVVEESAGWGEDASKVLQLRIEFRTQGSRQPLLDGQAAVRTFAADDQMMQTVRLHVEEDAWLAMVELSSIEETLIKVGSKLDDGKKRIYRFFYRPVSLTDAYPVSPDELSESLDGQETFQ